MLAELVVAGLMRANLAASAAILVVILLRIPVGRSLGADAAWRLWRFVPAAAVASLFPGLIVSDAAWLDEATAPMQRFAAAFDIVWLAGALASAIAVFLQEAAFRRRAAHGLAGPAAMGALWPRIVTPLDFSQRFTPEQRALIVAHERAHITRGDTRAALAITVARSLAWLNPLAHLASRLARLDQELACDAEVLAAQPDVRRAYAEALLCAQRPHLGASGASCGWLGRSSLEVRLRAISHPIHRRASTIGSTLLTWSPVLAGLVVWVAQPAERDRPAEWRRPVSVILIDLTPAASHPHTFRSAS